MELGIISLSDLTADPHTGRPVSALHRLDATLAYARTADELGLDVFALGEHHSHKFAVASPAVVLASGRRVAGLVPASGEGLDGDGGGALLRVRLAPRPLTRQREPWAATSPRRGASRCGALPNRAGGRKPVARRVMPVAGGWGKIRASARTELAG
jgi:hypothetical protein